MKSYHIGYEDAGKRPFGYSQKPGLLIIHACKEIDSLPPYLWRYLGVRETTKKTLRERIMVNIQGFLDHIERTEGVKFTAIEIR